MSDSDQDICICTTQCEVCNVCMHATQAYLHQQMIVCGECFSKGGNVVDWEKEGF